MLLYYLHYSTPRERNVAAMDIGAQSHAYPETWRISCYIHTELHYTSSVSVFKHNLLHLAHVLYGVASEDKACISTSTNLSYGQVEGVKAEEYEICDMPSGAAMATQEPAYETISTCSAYLHVCIYQSSENRG